MMLPVAYETGLTSVAIKEMIYCHRILRIRENPAVPEEAQRFPWSRERASAAGAAGHDHVGDPRAGRRGQAGRDLRREHARIRAIRPEETRHINKWLADNCFGDYYTRGGLDTREREMVTLCFLAAQGGCEPQLTAHAKANMVVGNEKAFLIAVVSQCMPYIGYPRTLNAIRCIDEAVKG